MLLSETSIKDKFLYRKISIEQKDFLFNILKKSIDFYSGEIRDGKPLKYLDLSQLKKLIAEDIPLNGCSLNDLENILEEKVLQYSIAQFDQKYLSFPDTGNSLAGLSADIVTPFLNQNLIAVDRSAPVATFVEMQLIFWLRKLVGYSYSNLNDDNLKLEDVGGMWTSGGNMSNHVAVLVAMHNKFPLLKERGIFDLKKRPCIILAKGIEHFSFSNAAIALGLGEKGIRWAKSNSNYKTDINSIEEELIACEKDQVEPFMVISVAGNCRTTNIDNIEAIGKLCKKYNIWFHVDACHGGSLLFSKKFKKYLKGVHIADSISLDPHKGLFVTYPSSYVLFKDPKTLSKFSRYPEKAKDPSCLDLGLIMPFYGSRGFHSLKLWMLIKHMGINGIDQAIDSRSDVNIEITQILKKSELFILVNENEFYRQAFLFCPKNVHKEMLALREQKEFKDDLFHDLVSKYTKLFCQSLYERGNVIFDLFSLPDLDNKVGLGSKKKYNMMAMAIGHPFIDRKAKIAIYQEIKHVGNIFRKKMIEELSSLNAKNNSNLESLQETGNFSPASW